MANLSQEFGVSIRTIKRDIDELTFLMPIYIKRGKYDGGIYVIEDYTMDRMYMTAEQINLLIKVKKLVSDKLSENENGLFDYIIKSFSKSIVK